MRKCDFDKVVFIFRTHFNKNNNTSKEVLNSPSTAFVISCSDHREGSLCSAKDGVETIYKSGLTTLT